MVTWDCFQLTGVDLNLTVYWDELDHRVKEKKPKSAQHMWELVQERWRRIPGDYLMAERKPRVCKTKVAAFGNPKQI